MERERVQGYVASLEQVIRNSHLNLKEAMTQFQEYSQWFTIERTVPPAIVTDIRKTYKGIHDQLIKIRGIHQLLESRYRQYYRRDTLRDREISEFGILSKSLYSRFETMLQGMESKTNLTGAGEDSGVYQRRTPSQWFRSTDNQVILQRTLRELYDLDYIYKSCIGSDAGRRQRLTQDKLRSLSLFTLSGEGGLIDIVQFRMQLREYDIKERYAKNELRGALTHLREISISEVEGVLKRFMDSREAAKLKGLLISIQSHEDLGKQTLFSAENVLQRMTGGEVRTLQI